jgi:hypothetical protein
MTSERAPLALVLVALAACDQAEPGIEVALMTSAMQAEETAHETIDLRDRDGSGVEVAHLHVSVRSIELLECPSVSFTDLFLGTAYAHSRSSPLLLSAPHEIDALRMSPEDRALGTLRPPPGRYCGLRLSFGTRTMEGLEWQGGQSAPFSLESTESIVAEAMFDSPLVLSNSQKTASISYAFALDEGRPAGANELLRSLPTSLRVHVRL